MNVYVIYDPAKPKFGTYLVVGDEFNPDVGDTLNGFVDKLDKSVKMVSDSFHCRYMSLGRVDDEIYIDSLPGENLTDFISYVHEEIYRIYDEYQFDTGKVFNEDIFLDSMCMPVSPDFFNKDRAEVTKASENPEMMEEMGHTTYEKIIESFADNTVERFNTIIDLWNMEIVDLAKSKVDKTIKIFSPNELE